MSGIKKVCDLKSCFLCKACLVDWIPAIANHRQNIYIKKGQSIFREGDPVTGLYFVYEGVFKVHKRWDQEREFILRFAKKGDILGHLGLGDQPAYPISATAIESGVVCYVDMSFFDSTLNVNHEFVIRLMRFFANELQESEQKMRNLVHMAVRGRIAQSLIFLKQHFGISEDGHLAIGITRQDLASYSGVVYETLFKTLNEFEQKGVITIKGKNIEIKDEAALTRIIDADKTF